MSQSLMDRRSMQLKAHHRSWGGFRNPWLRGGAGDPPDGAGRLFRAGRPLQVAGLLHWLVIERLIRPRPPDPHPSALPRATPAFASPRAAERDCVITWIGHSTFLVQVGGLNLLTDPMWSPRASPVPFTGPRRWVPPGTSLESLPPIDAVAVSHNHYDHLDHATVVRLAVRHPDATWLAPLGLGRFLRRRGAQRVVELDWWGEARVGTVRFGCTPAQHFSSRHIADHNRTLWCGWSIAAPTRRVFFAGDTGYHPEFGEIGRRFGPFDALLLPIGAYEPRWFMWPVHMNPEEAVRAFGDVQQGAPGLLVPMHWGTFKLTDEPMDEPPVRLAAAWRAAKLPGALWIPAHGETRSIKRETGSGKRET